MAPVGNRDLVQQRSHKRVHLIPSAKRKHKKGQKTLKRSLKNNRQTKGMNLMIVGGDPWWNR